MKKPDTPTSRRSRKGLSRATEFSNRNSFKTILVVEDEPGAKGICRGILSGYNLLEARTAEEALGLFCGSRTHIDLLISSVALPSSCGLHLALLLRAELPELQVLLMSEVPQRNWQYQDADDFDRLGPSSVVVVEKPILPALLLKTVYGLIGRPLTWTKAA